MQFIWLYVDEMLGKGIEWYVIAELLLYSSANVVPLALPLSVLLASLMTFGNLGEHFELVSFKAAGISLQRVMRPLIIFVLLICLSAFLFSNYIMPVANLKFFSLLHDIRSKKPAVNIKPGVFYKEIDGYVLRVMDKEELENGTEMLKDVMIYNHTQSNGNRNLTVADSAIMSISEDQTYFSIRLFHGTDYQDQAETTTNKSYPLSRFSFEENEMRISLTGFEFNRTDEDAFKHDYRLFNLKQLEVKSDTLKVQYDHAVSSFTYLIKQAYMFNDSIFNRMKTDTLVEANTQLLSVEENMKKVERDELNQIYSIAINNARTNKGRSSAAASETLIKKRDLARMAIEWHRKYSFSFACLVPVWISVRLRHCTSAMMVLWISIPAAASAARPVLRPAPTTQSTLIPKAAQLPSAATARTGLRLA